MLQPPDISPLIPHSHQLPNGATLHYFPNSALQLVKLDITLEAGSRYQQYKSQTHTANHLFGEATAHHDARTVAEFLDFRGIVVERSTDVCTATVTFYFLRRYADELFPLIREMFDTYESPNSQLSLLNSQLFDACVANRRQQLAVGFQKTSYVARNRFYEILYGTEHPLGTYAVPEDMDLLTLDAVIDFIRQYYRLEYAKLILSGSVDDALLSLADQYLAPSRSQFSIPNEPLLPPPAPTNSQFSILNSQFEKVQSTIRIGRILPMSWDSPDYARFMVLNTVLGGYFGSRLMSNLREDKGYTYGIYSTTQIFRGSIVFYITADVAAQATEDAIVQINHEIERLRQEPVSQDELDRVRNYMMGDFIRSIDGAFEISERYRQMVSTGIDDRITTHLLDAVATVTPDQLLSLAQTALTGLAQVVAGPC